MFYLFSKNILRVEGKDIAQLLKRAVAIPKDIGSVHSTHMTTYNWL